MKSKLIFKIISLIFILSPFGVRAGEATMSLSSANGVYLSTKNFTTRVIVNSGGGAGINACESKITFNPKELKVVSVSIDGSFLNLWPLKPKFDNKKGLIQFAGGTTKSYKDSAGVAMKITFEPLAKGNFLVGLSTSTSLVMTGDGYAQNILKEVDSGDYVFGNSTAVKNAENLRNKMVGRILLQVERNGRSWYVYPGDRMRYFLGRPVDAFNLMRKLGLGVSHSYILKYQDKNFPSTVTGKILIDVEDSGKAYYIYPVDNRAYYLGRPKDAFAIMRNLGLGISNEAIRKIPDWAI
jgi:hypothetical protein